MAIIELYPDKREESGLFSQITLRHTDRGQYEPEIEKEKLQKLKAKASAGLRPDLITDRIQFGSKAFRKKLASWLRHNWSKAGDGMPGYASSIPSIMSLLGPFFIRTFDIGKSQAEKDEELANNAVIGIVFEKIMLTATKLGLSIAFLNQPIEVPELRREVQNLLKMAELPQLLFRIGYAKAKTKTKHTPRRRLEEVVV